MSKIKINSYIYKHFTEKRQYKKNITNIQFQADLAKMYELEMDELLLISGLNNSFSYMGSSLIDQLVESGNKIDDIDLIILVYYIPDINPSISTINDLIEKYSLNADGFAVSGVGTYAPFVAIKIIKELFITKKYKKALLLILDQSTLPYITNINNVVDTGVACIFEPTCANPCIELDVWGFEPNINLHDWLRTKNQNYNDNIYIISSNLRDKYIKTLSVLTFNAPSRQLCTSLFLKLYELIKEKKICKGQSIYLLDGSVSENELYYMKINILGGKM